MNPDAIGPALVEPVREGQPLSKVQGSSATIARTQAYALRQLDALAEKVERTTRIGDLAETAKEAESKARDWLAALVRCFQLQDAIAVLELDRVLDVAPDDLDGHRVGHKAVRQKRLDTISQTTSRLLARMDAAAGTVGGGEGMGGRGRGVQGQGARDRPRWRRRVQAPRERDLRPGQVGDGRISSGIAGRTIRRREGDAERFEEAERAPLSCPFSSFSGTSHDGTW